MPNGRCRIHGGKTPSGPASPNWKTGKHSKVMKDLGLSARFEELLTSPELGELRDEIALTDLDIERVAPLALGATSTVEQRQELRDAIEQRRKLVDSLHKNATAVVPVERVLAFVHAVTNLTLEVLPDPRQKQAFLVRIASYMGRPVSDAARTDEQ